MEARFYIGTAGWSYLGWDKEFYPKGLPKGERLAFYATRLNAVELNNSFYHLPSAEQFAAWRAQVPETFRFAVKAPRTITHVKRLKDADVTVPPFVEAVRDMPDTTPLFFQLPPSFACDVARLETFVAQLHKGRRFAIELRHPSCHVPEVYALLERHGVAFCQYDTPEGVSPLVQTAAFSYTRLRGRDISNLTAFLGEWRDRLARQAGDAYVFFDNREQKNLAFGNALAFREIVGKP